MFITLEGIDGSGKTTALNYISDYLFDQKVDHAILSLPGGTTFGEKVKEILMEGNTLQKETELLLYLASHYEAITQIIKPALMTGKIVICDRFTDSTMAYQIHGKQLQYQRVEMWVRQIVGDLTPDHTFLFQIPVREALYRKFEKDPKDKYGFDFYERVSVGYEKLAKKHSKRFTIIDALQPLPTVRENVLNKIDDLVKKSVRDQRVSEKSATLFYLSQHFGGLS